jgi:hypothetical protein
VKEKSERRRVEGRKEWKGDGRKEGGKWKKTINNYIIKHK